MSEQSPKKPLVLSATHFDFPPKKSSALQYVCPRLTHAWHESMVVALTLVLALIRILSFCLHGVVVDFAADRIVMASKPHLAATYPPFLARELTVPGPVRRCDR